MANETLETQLNKLKELMKLWETQLSDYTNWARNNDGVISPEELNIIEINSKEIKAIQARIQLIEKSKGINQGDQTQNSNAQNNNQNPIGNISASVGASGKNTSTDTAKVQTLLNKYGYALIVDGDCGPRTIAAIKKFQAEKVGLSNPDGVVDPGGRTWQALNGNISGSENQQSSENQQTQDPLNPSQSSQNTEKITGSVGQGGSNADVMLIKKLLNKSISSGLTENDINCGPKTIAAIKKFQTEKLGSNKATALIEPDSESWKVLNGATTTNNDNNQLQTNSSVTPSVVLSAQVGLGKANKSADVAAIQQLLNNHGYNFTVDGIFTNELSTAINKFQKDKVGLSSPDGVVDPGGKTWKTLKGENTQTNSNNTTQGPINKPNWISIAEGEVGQKEKAGSEHNPRIIEYHATTGKSKNDETPWCSSFVNWVMNKAGHGGTNSAMAVSWAKWGKKVSNPSYGAIAVIDWDGPGPGWKGHVGFVVGKQGSSILLLGGNQSNAVNVKSFGTSLVIAYVYPSNFQIPENYLTFGEAQGNFGEETDISDTR